MKKVLKWFGIVLGSLVVIVLLAVLVLYTMGSMMATRKYSTEVESVSLANSPEAVARGKHLAESVSLCVDCHGDNLSGTLMSDDPMIAILAATNLTSGQGGVGATYSDADFVRVLRHGLRPDGTSLFIMPSNYYAYYNDADLAAIIAYIRSVQPVDNTLPKVKTGPMGRVLTGLGMFPPTMAEMIKKSGAKPSQVTPGVTKEYGEYVSNIAACRDCHGPNLAGNVPGNFAPYGPNLTPGGELARWSETDFVNAIRTGQTPTGRTLSDDMPWKKYGQMTDEELKALWAYLSTVEALETNPTGN
jgi:mono/diheme cytochrome c family protein